MYTKSRISCSLIALFVEKNSLTFAKVGTDILIKREEIIINERDG